MSKIEVKISHNTIKEVRPIGLTSLVVSYEKESEFSFFRQKVNGSLAFTGENFKTIESVQDGCCGRLPVTLFRSCNSVPVPAVSFLLPTRKVDWNFETCEATVSNFEVSDVYEAIFKAWERKVNMCETPVSGKTLRHWLRITNTSTESGESVDSYTYPYFNNSKGKLFIEWVLFCIEKTFVGSLSGIVPDNVFQLSTFLSSQVNFCTGRKNELATALIFQNSDIFQPNSPSATGKQEDGRINEEIGVSLKSLVEGLKAAFDVDFFVDSITGKFRIEHKSFFENGHSYGSVGLSLDLSAAKYSKDLKGYKHSFRYDDSEIEGVQELVIPQNQSSFDADNAIVVLEYSLSTGKGIYLYEVPKIDDFHLGNIKYESDCVKISDNGEVLKKSVSCELFSTFANAVFMQNDSVDINGWTLFDVVENGDFMEVRNGICERTTLANVPNARFSASSLMRDYHRWARPFVSGLMNYSDSPFELIGKGYVREMYSTKFDKIFREAEVGFCCGDALDIRKLVKMPNGSIAKIQKAEISYSKDRLTLQLNGISSCGKLTVFPEENTTEYPERGTLLATRDAETSCYALSYVGPDYGCVGFNSTIQGKIYVYADGEGGSYIVQDFPECPKDDEQC